MTWTHFDPFCPGHETARFASRRVESDRGVLCRELSAKLRVAKACSECLKLVAVIAGTFQATVFGGGGESRFEPK